MTYRQVLEEGKNILSDSGIFEASNDAWLLFEYAFGMDRTAYFLKSGDNVENKDSASYFELIKRRASHEPLQYITQKAYFMGHEFFVSEGVLIPRFDTEILVEEALKHLHGGEKVLDVCTGSGCIAISLALSGRPELVTGVDISDKALDISRINKEANHADLVEFIKSDMFEQVFGTYDMIVSNPPYIRTADIEKLETEVKNREPYIALWGHDDGLFFYRILAKKSPEFLKENGMLIMETGYDQADEVACLLEQNKFTDITVIKDLAGLDRVVSGRRK